MNDKFATAPPSSDFDEVAAVMAEEGLDLIAPVNDDGGEAAGVVSKADIERISEYPKFGRASVGEDGKLMVGAAIGTREEDKVRGWSIW